ncbi:unnamed protein product [Brassica rapa]|uniref:FAD/NAD(P)-binding domain-containing protein n=1 Tax=Brassica campestris TaxID=3711 RepID=A0A8D9MA72_BRACM|nr:unnamed protein product [Brassica rapa]
MGFRTPSPPLSEIAIMNNLLLGSGSNQSGSAPRSSRRQSPRPTCPRGCSSSSPIREATPSSPPELFVGSGEGAGGFWSRGISACVVCDGAALIFRNKPLVVIGGVDSTMEEMKFLTKYRSKVYIIHRCDTFRALKIMQQRVLSKPKIEVIWNSSVVEAYRDENGKGVLGGLKVKNVVTGDVSDLKMSGLFFVIVHEPATKFLDGQHELDEYEYVVSKPGTTKTIVLLCEAVDS